MYPLARPPVREAMVKPSMDSRAFTLIELLTVISIIAILATISLGIVRGVNQRAGISRAKAELAVLASALDAYKRQYGDYPQAGKSAGSDGSSSDTGTTEANVKATPVAATLVSVKLFNALVGKLGPGTSASQMVAINGKSFIELGALTLESSDNEDLPSNTGTDPVPNSFLDPWGNRYLYYYKAAGSANSWPASRGYILMSAGPDGLLTAPSITATTIDLQPNGVHNGDNIYANH